MRSVRFAAALAAALALLIAPAAAQAKIDLGVSATASSHLVAVGQPVSFNATVANHGTEAFPQVYLELSSLRGHGQGANNPYTVVSTSQGTCKDNSAMAYGYQYYDFVCELGELAPGASVTLNATVTVNESMNHFFTLLPNAYEGGYMDDDNSNNVATDRITANAPPAISGSKAIKLHGLPPGCVPGDFTLHASTKAPGVKKMSASMDLGYDREGVGHSIFKVVKGTKLVV
ncbi:MAG TPA: hypothetical protein VGF09_09495, partial [Solirubrobacterales bacterium]